MKKILSIIMIAALMLTLMTVPAFAEDEGAGPADPAGYYLVGSMNGWQADPAYLLERNTEQRVTEEYTITLTLSAKDQFKIAYFDDTHTTIGEDNLYPDGMGNDLSVDKDGEVTIRFCPNGDGEDDWTAMVSDPSKKVVKIETAPEPGYYLVGDITQWKFMPVKTVFLFQKNEASSYEEYSLVTLFHHSESFKVVYSKDETTIAENGWYPDGVDNNITVDRDGWYRITLRPNGDGENDWVAMGSDPLKKVIKVEFVSPLDDTPTELPSAAVSEDPTEEPPTILPSEAEPTEPSETEYLYKDKFLQKLGMRQLVSYDELY